MKKFFLTAIMAAALCFAAGNVQSQEAGGTRATVTQATSLATGVTANGNSGTITTVSATTAALGTSTFVVTNSSVLAAGQVVNAFLEGYGGTWVTNGIPYVTVSAVTAGSFTVRISNLHTANALAGTLTIGFTVQ